MVRPFIVNHIFYLVDNWSPPVLWVISMQGFIEECVQEALHNGGIAPATAQGLLETDTNLLPLFLYGAGLIRDRCHGQGMRLCAIVNAKSGRCPEDCAFCAQSAHHRTRIETYPLMEPGEILRTAQEAEAMGARRFSIVTSGKALTAGELEKVVQTLSLLKKKTGLCLCASLGMLSERQAQQLKEAGLNRYHHNLETAPSFFAEICTTHRYEEALDTLRCAQGAGLEVCSGGIFGLGESVQQRLELAYTLKEIGVDSIALNFLNPIPGTPLEGAETLTPLEILQSVALFRFILPHKDIRICGGREVGLRELHPLVVLVGANGIMIGNYLTTQGRDHRADLQMIADLGMTVVDG